MRNITKLFALSILSLCVAAGITRAADTAKVDSTRVADDVKGLVKLGTVHGKSSRVFGNQDSLRAKAIAQAEAEAAKLGATIILIVVDNFEATPINNVAIEAVAYGPANATAPKAEVKKDAVATPAVAATAPDKIEVTRLPDDVKGKTKLGVVHGKAMKVFGNQDSLRAKAIVQAQTEAAKLGGTILLITLDKFEATPLNNVAIEAYVYR